MKKTLKFLIWSILTFLLALAIFLRMRYGGGEEYPDITTTPLLPTSAIEEFFTYPEPLGNVAASSDTGGVQRVFFTVHPESRPSGHKVLEIVNGEAKPYPSADYQINFTTVLGMFCDQQDRLWTIDHGNHGFQGVTLTAFDLGSNTVTHSYVFPTEVAERLSFFNDLSVTPDGHYVFVADVSFFGKQPSLIVYDVEKGVSRSLLDGHPSVNNEGFVPVNPLKKMRFFGGLVDLMPGIDGLDVSLDGAYIYYAAMSHSGLYRLPVAIATDWSQSVESIAERVERVADKPLSDGIRTDTMGNVYITDVEHGGFSVVDTEGILQTVFKDDRIRWADGASLAADGYMYFTDSAIPDQMLRSKKHMQASAPYSIFRFRPPYELLKK